MPKAQESLPLECKQGHTYGVCVGWDGELLFTDRDFQRNPMTDTRFDFCPFCGKDLRKEVTGNGDNRL